MREMTLEGVKKAELDCLIWLDEFCKEHSIKYVLAYGTMLGAVRHKGFIPWDDDIDVAMLREDYEHFCHLMKYENEKEGTRFKFVEHSINPSYNYPFGKLYNTDTILLEPGKNIGVDMGAYVDVFPFDDDSPNPIVRKYRKKLMNIRRKPMAFILHKGEHGGGKATNSFWNVVHKALEVTGIERMMVEHYINGAKLLNGRHSETVNALWWYNDVKQIPKSFFFERIPLEFEGHYFYAAKDYDKWLTILYKDYMTLPPEDKRVTNHIFKAYYKD